MAVVSLGSVNVDHVVRADARTVEALAARHDWFPEAGETVSVPRFPPAFDEFEATHLLGGKGANQAVAAAKAEAAAAFLGKVGPDDAEYGVRSGVASAGVDVSGVGRADVRTGAAFIFVDETGENHIVVTPGANGAVDHEYVREHRDTVDATAVLLLQNEIPVDPAADLLARLARAADRPTVVLDPAPAPGVEPLVRSGAVDVLTPNETEYADLVEAGTLADFDGTLVRKRGPKAVVVEGAEAFRVQPPAVDPVDTTGAGDVFNGYLAAGLAAGDPLREAVDRATAAASLSVTAEGVQRATPSLADVEAFRKR